MYFDQKIKYLDYLEGGARVRGAGFLRLECWGKTCNLVLQASGLFEQAQGSYPVYLQGEGREEHLGDLFLQNGKGRLELRNLNCESMGASQGMSAAEIEGIRIPLGESRQLVGILREGKVPENARKTGGGAYKAREPEAEKSRKALKEEKDEMAPETEISGADLNKEAQGDVAIAKRNEVPDSKRRKELEEEQNEGNAVEPGEAPDEGNVVKSKKMPDGGDMAESEETQNGGKSMERRNSESSFASHANLKPGKWEQLLAIYPSITPFGDVRRYLQISPGDFVILKDRSYRMVNNSFLLHGYFTYRHLILHRQNRRGEMAYYVGVPGRYYDREKEVAILFGFESFEGAAEPAGEGDFGYYMMRVEL
ncbi:MAG: hypothetical protein K6F51_06570 [Acetatifactor sp.]|nr:hypothetical protein [Acetatifactor sp.]